MLFHMLRLELGDEPFIEGLRRFYRLHRFRFATFDDLQAAFQAVSPRPLDAFFAQWLQHTGAPALKLRDAFASPAAEGHTLTAVVEQVQDGPAYALSLPFAVQLEGIKMAYQGRVAMRGRRHELHLALPARPTRLEVDPEYDLFRRLERGEIPPALSQLFAAEQVWLVLPSTAPPALQRAYRGLADAWRGERAVHIEVRRDDELAELPGDAAVWLLGWENRFHSRIAQALHGQDFTITPDGARLAGRDLSRARDTLVVAGRNPQAPSGTLAWIASTHMDALPGLARKLPHYGRYSYLVFTGTEPTNAVKGQWPVRNSPLARSVAQTDGYVTSDKGPAQLAPRRSLAEVPASYPAVSTAARPRATTPNLDRQDAIVLPKARP
jgi:hypothetical protein